MRGLLIGLLVLGAVGCQRDAGDSEEIVVFAAASLTDVVDALAAAYQDAHPGTRVTVSVGASSTLARQIAAGAPAGVYLSASPEWTAFLQEERLVRGGPVTLAQNRLVLLGAPDAEPLVELADLRAIERIAVADPSHVPAGQYAREVLSLAGLWDELHDQLLPALDVRAAVTAVSTGRADIAIAYASDTLVAPHLQVVLDLPEALQPIIQIVGVVTGRGEVRDEAFLAFLADPGQASTWEEFGFRPLAEAP
ncbi:MAG: molybdate ABC transporter substrate-binding protein [Rhodothermaceae bacterium]|nr:molybdate ABC transporter substrate-binding protein [Rhodothermaceae bacterium]